MAGKKVAILQSNYVPWKGYFDIIGSVDEFIIYDEVQYTKNDWRNRNKIKTPSGTQWLTIPVNHSLSQKISQTEVSLTTWGKKNWNSLKTNYSKATHFKDFSPHFEEFYLTSQFKRLSDINVWLIQRVCEILNISTPITQSTIYELKGDPTERLVNICKQAGAGTYLSGPAAKNYLCQELFTQENIAIEWMDYSSYLEYPQLFPPFEHGVTILDLLFNTGPDAANFMKIGSK